MEIKQFTIEEDSAELRIDKVLTEEMPEHSRSFFQKLLKDGRVSVNGRAVKPSYKVKPGDIIEIAFGNKTVRAEVVKLYDTTKKEDAGEMFKYLD